MHITVSWRNAAIITFWLVILGFIPTVFLSTLWFVPSFIGYAIYTFLCMTLGTFYLTTFKVHVGKHHLTVRHGILFLFTHRIPLRFVTGCHVYCSFLQKRTGSCILLLLCSGGFVLCPGIPLDKAEIIATKITFGGKE